jgi:hypothetical protein
MCTSAGTGPQPRKVAGNRAGSSASANTSFGGAGMVWRAEMRMRMRLEAHEVKSTIPVRMGERQLLSVG